MRLFKAVNNLIHFDTGAEPARYYVDYFLQLKGERNLGNANGLRLHHQSHIKIGEICGNKRVVNILFSGRKMGLGSISGLFLLLRS